MTTVSRPKVTLRSSQPEARVRSKAAPPAAVQGLLSPPWKQKQLQQSHCSVCAACLGEGRDVAARDSLHGPIEINPTLPARCFRTAPMSMWKPILKSAVCNYETRDVVSLTAGNLLICNLHWLFQGSVSRPQNDGSGIFNPHFRTLKIQGYLTRPKNGL